MSLVIRLSLTVLVQMSTHASADVPEPPTLPASCYLATDCSASCGEGFRLLLPNRGEITCMSGVLQVLPCQERVCPTHCRWEEWSRWEECGRSVGGGHPLISVRRGGRG